MSLHLVVGVRRAEKKSLWKSHGRTAFATAPCRRVKPPFGFPGATSFFPFKDVPIHAFHGELDSAVPVGATREMIAALEKAGGKPKVTIYPGVDHVCWTQTYDDPELYRWIFARRKRHAAMEKGFETPFTGRGFPVIR